MISNVPAIISTSASPTDCEPTHPMVDLKMPLPTKRQGRPLPKAISSEQHSLNIDARSDSSHRKHHQPHQNSDQEPHKVLQQSQARSEDSTYCTKCGGVTTHDRHSLSKKRYFSLDKERNEKTSNLLQCLTMTCSDPIKCVSDNILVNSCNQYPFDASADDKSIGKPRTIKTANNHTNNVPNNNNNNININNNSIGQNNNSGGKAFLATLRQMCDKCDSNAITQSRGNGPAKKSGSHRSDCGNSCSNRSLRDKSSKSSQNSLRESRTSRKNSFIQLNVSEMSGTGGGGGGGGSDRPKPKRISSQHSRKTSTRATSINLHEDQDAETREILLGTTSTTSYSKFDIFPPELKIPEPVEAVCIVLTFVFE